MISRLAILLPLLAPSNVLSFFQDVEQQFALTATDSVHAARFFQIVATCASASDPFRSLVRSDSEALATEIADTDGVTFAANYRNDTLEPFFVVYLPDLERLPPASQVTRWRPDSSWALTRCEVLGHEIAEAVEYRRRWRMRPAGLSGRGLDAWCGVEHRAAHGKALKLEAQIAKAQGIRDRVRGVPISRTRTCVHASEIFFIFGQHVETITLDASDHVRRIRYGGTGPPVTARCTTP